MDEKGQAVSPDTASAHHGNGGHLEAHHTSDDAWTGVAPTSDDSLVAVVSAWREPAAGAIAGRASVAGQNGNGNGMRRRAEVRDAPYAELLAPVSPPVSGAPPQTTPGQPPVPTQRVLPGQPTGARPTGPVQLAATQGQPPAPQSPPPAHAAPQPEPSPSALHYGHYGPDGQGWPHSSDMPASYRPMPTYPAAGQSGYSAAEPTYAAEPVFPVPADPAPPEPSYPVQAQSGYPAPAQPGYPVLVEGSYPAAASYPTPVEPGYSGGPSYPPASGGPSYPGEPGDPAQPRAVPSERTYVPVPALPAFPPSARLDQTRPAPTYDAAPLFDQQPPPEVPEFGWSVPAYPPSGALTSQTPVHGTAIYDVPDDAVAPGSSPAYSSQSHGSQLHGSQLHGSQSRGSQSRGSQSHRSPAHGLSSHHSAQLSASEPDAPSALPQRVPSEPDVPAVPEVEPTVSDPPHAGAPDLARIATYLRHDEEDGPLPDGRPDGRPDGFDIPAVLDAVRGVPGVREAVLRGNPKPGGVHKLRLELTDDADPGWVSRAVARLLNERMGLAAEPNLPMAEAPSPAVPAPPRGPTAPVAHSTMPTHGREARRHRPISGQRRSAELERPTEAGQAVSGRERVSRALPRPGAIVSPRVVIEQVEVTTHGVDAIVEVRLSADGAPAIGVASGPAVDGYILRLSAAAAAAAVDELLVDVETGSRPRCFVEHTALVPLGSCEVAVVVLLLMCDGWVDQLTGSAIVAGDPRQAVVRATLAAVNRRLEALLP